MPKKKEPEPPPEEVPMEAPAEEDPNKPKPRPQNKRLQQTQAQVDEVVGIMRMNVEKVLERDQKLTQLDDRADALQNDAGQFEKSAATLKNKMWWKNMKMTIIMGVVVLVVIIIIAWKFGFVGGGETKHETPTVEPVAPTGENPEEGHTGEDDEGQAEGGKTKRSRAARYVLKYPGF